MKRGHQQLGILPPGLTSIPIQIIGVGGIGSFTVLALAKMGFSNITAYDFDTIEEHNVDNQLYGEVHKSMKKVGALKTIIKILANVSINAMDQKVDKITNTDGGIVIFAVDDIDIRTALFNTMKFANGYLIDARMGAEAWTVYTVNLNSLEQRKWYSSFLHPSSESLQLDCTAKSIMYTPFSVGGEIAFRVKQIVTNQPYERKKDHAFVQYTEPPAEIKL